MAKESSWIDHISHDAPDTLHVFTRSGKHYVHKGVSAQKHELMRKASSLGQFFNQHIAKQHPGRLIQ